MTSLLAIFFSDTSPQARETKEKKINKWDHIKLKRFCTAKEIFNKMKRQPTEWKEILLANDISDKRLRSKIHKELIQPNTKTTTIIQFKNGHFSKEDIQRGQQT